jgi:hypothetical protein
MSFQILKYTKALLGLGILFLMVSACNNKKDDDSVLIFVSPISQSITAGSNEVITFKISAMSNNNPISRLRVDVKELGKYVTLIDSTVLTKNLNLDYDYVTKYYGSNTSLLFRFYVWDTNGNQAEGYKQVDVIVGNDQLLAEKTGINLYSKGSGGKDAYDIATNTLFYNGVGDSTNIDIIDTTGSSTLSRVWVSKTGGKFAIFKTGSGFNYSSATKTMIINAYENAQKADLVSNIEKNDVIIFYSQKRNIYAAILVKGVNDNTGRGDDYYEFNIKN